MVRFTAFALSVWATTHVVAAEQSVRKVTDNNPSRKLSPERIGGYQPKSIVTDMNALDLDQKYMEIELAKETTTGYVNAQAIYQLGGNSKSYAEITLDDAIQFGIAKGTTVEGPSIGGGRTFGTVYRNVPTGQKKVRILYDTSEDQSTWVKCRVGALKANQGLETSGCKWNPFWSMRLPFPRSFSC